MKKKVLFVATVDRGHILKFHLPYLKYFKENDFEVHVACSGNAEIPYCDKRFKIPFKRSPFKLSNISAYRILKKIINKNEYSLIHCHTPVGGVIGRLAGKDARRTKGTKIYYTAHGFHFFKGASILNWLIFYPIEKWLSRYTDNLITINQEDYQRAVGSNFKTNNIKLINGVGVDLNNFSVPTTQQKLQLRSKYNFKTNDFILIYVAELNRNKNQDLLINTINVLKDIIPNIKLLFAGDGKLTNYYKNRVKELGLENHIIFLGFRTDISYLMKVSDIAVSSSKREGLPVNIMEAMATGLPLVVTDCRGNRDLVSNEENGFVVGNEDINGFVSAIKKLYENKELSNHMSKKSVSKVKEYSLEIVMKEMENVYSY